MEEVKVEDIKIYVQKHYPSYYNKFKETISRFNEDLQVQLETYYLNIITYKYRFVKSSFVPFTNILCDDLKELNTPDLEYYIEFSLQFYEDCFLDILKTIKDICLATNMVLVQICKNFIRYAERKDREELVKNIFKYIVYTNEDQNEEVLEILNDVMEVEKKHILECYEKAKNGETFCDMCAPYCRVEKEKTKSKGALKRTTPFRIY